MKYRKTSAYFLPSVLCLVLFSACSSGNRNEGQPEDVLECPSSEYRHDYHAAETLYSIGQIYGLSVPRDEFHRMMENPANAEKFLGNMFEAGVLDKKSDILFWIVRLYDSLPPELGHLDLCRGIDADGQMGTDDDLIEALSLDEPASIDDIFGPKQNTGAINEDDFYED